MWQCKVSMLQARKINNFWQFWLYFFGKLKDYVLYSVRGGCLVKFSHIALRYFQNVTDYLFRKTLQKLNHQQQSLEWILNVIFIDEWGWLSRPWAQISQSVGGGAEAHINHVSSMLLTFGATGRFGLRPLQEHPLQRPLVNGGLYTQVNNSPCPEGSTNNTPSITKGRERKRVGSEEGKETTNIYLVLVLSLFLTIFFMIYDRPWEAWSELIGSGEFKKESLVQVWKHFRRFFCEKRQNIENNRLNSRHVSSLFLKAISVA